MYNLCDASFLYERLYFLSGDTGLNLFGKHKFQNLTHIRHLILPPPDFYTVIYFPIFLPFISFKWKFILLKAVTLYKKGKNIGKCSNDRHIDQRLSKNVYS